MHDKPANTKESQSISGDFSQDKAFDQETSAPDLESQPAGDSSQSPDSSPGPLPGETHQKQSNQTGETQGVKEHPEDQPAQIDKAAEGDVPDHSAEIARLKDQLLRAMAEMENLRRRSTRELEDRVKYAPGELARDLLPVADNLDRALSSLDAEARAADERLEQFAAGIEAISRDFLAAFEKNGIRRLDPINQPFNPSEHEAMLKIQDDSHPPGTVVQVMQAGYILRDRLLRPAMVGVAEGGAQPKRVDEKA